MIDKPGRDRQHTKKTNYEDRFERQAKRAPKWKEDKAPRWREPTMRDLGPEDFGPYED